jgi:aryl-alcohol dehydrogenase-like predicted oxidoreductase
VLDAAWSLGIRYFDAARSYGRAEEFLGHWLAQRRVPHEQVTVGSKWGYTYTADWQVSAEHHEIKDHSLPVLNRQFRESREHLGSYLSLYQIHSATRESGVLRDQAVLQELARLRANGLRIGLSLSGPNQAETLKEAIEIRVNGERVFDAVQATWNLLEPSAGAALQEAHDAGLGVMVKEALANGRLTARNQEHSFRARLAILDEAAHALDTTIDALALAAVIAQPWVDIILSGATTAEQLASNAKGFQVQWPEEMADMLPALVESPEQYWDFRKKLPWN